MHKLGEVEPIYLLIEVEVCVPPVIGEVKLVSINFKIINFYWFD